ncbi:MAG: protein kinase [Polyangia bacterium]|nr:protein kinase [Polyangia bacterium]
MQPPSDPQSVRSHSEALAAKRPPRRYSPPGSFAGATLAIEPVPIVKGTLIGDYRVERRLDEGGMGTVYAAVHPIIDKRVAIKVLHPHVARQEEAVARFIQEARAVNAIGHPGIVDIFGFGRFVDGRHFITMEYLEGQQLLAFLNETGPISPVDMLPVARQLAESLAAAHDKGVVHRDMKPENVFLGVTASTYKDQPWPPRTKILDFGLAKLIEAELDDAAPRTRAGVTVGTPYYMSPEQCRGKSLDRRADIYSLGVMMYEMITGRVPYYAAESVDVLYMHLTQAPEPPSRHRPVPREVEALILGCMAKSAAERPSSMHELVAELDRILRALSPDAARDRDPEELQAEASAFFGGWEDGSPPEEDSDPQEARIRPSVPTRPSDLGQAALQLAESQAEAGSLRAELPDDTRARNARGADLGEERSPRTETKAGEPQGLPSAAPLEAGTLLTPCPSTQSIAEPAPAPGETAKEPLASPPAAPEPQAATGDLHARDEAARPPTPALSSSQAPSSEPLPTPSGEGPGDPHPSPAEPSVDDALQAPDEDLGVAARAEAATGLAPKSEIGKETNSIEPVAGQSPRHPHNLGLWILVIVQFLVILALVALLLGQR